MSKALFAALLALCPACNIIKAIHTAEQKPDEIIAGKTQTELDKLDKGGDVDLDLDGTADATVTVTGSTVTQVWHGESRDRIKVTFSPGVVDMVGDLDEDGRTDFVFHSENNTEVETRDRNFDGTEDWRRTRVITGATDEDPGTVADTVEELKHGSFVQVSTRTHGEKQDSCPPDMTPPPTGGGGDGVTCDGSQGAAPKSSSANGPNHFPGVHIHDGGDAGACTTEERRALVAVFNQTIPATLRYLKQWNLTQAVIYANGIHTRALHVSCNNTCTYATTDLVPSSRVGASVVMNIGVQRLLAHDGAHALSDPGVQGTLTETLAHELLHFVGIDHGDGWSEGADLVYGCARRIADCKSHLMTARTMDSARDCTVCASDDKRVQCGATQRGLVGEDDQCSPRGLNNVPMGTLDVCLVSENPRETSPCTCCKVIAWTYCDDTRITDKDRPTYEIDAPACCLHCTTGANDGPCNNANLVDKRCTIMPGCDY